MKRVIIDTNALMAIAEFKIDIFSELEKVCDFPYETFVVQGTIDELESIKAHQKGKNKRAAKLVLSLLKAKNVQIINESGYVDDILVACSIQGDLIVTQDARLKRRLTKPYGTIRQKTKLILVK